MLHPAWACCTRASPLRQVVEKPPFFMKPTDHRKVIHVNFFAASVSVTSSSPSCFLIYPMSKCAEAEDGGVQVDSVYFPQHEVVGDIGNGIWQLKERLKESPLPEWDLRYARPVRPLSLNPVQELRTRNKTASQARHLRYFIREGALF